MISLSFVLPIGMLGYGLLSMGSQLVPSLILFIVFCLLSFAFFKIVFPYVQRNSLKEGSLGILYLISVSVIFLINNVVQLFGKAKIFEKESLLWVLIIIISIVVFVKQELVEKSTSKK